MIFARTLFFTPTPELSFALGKIWVDSKGKRWRMTKCRAVGLSGLTSGGNAMFWRVKGKPV